MKVRTADGGLYDSHVRCPFQMIRAYVEMLDEEDRRRIRWAGSGPGFGIRAMRYRIEDEGFTAMNTWILGELLRTYLMRAGKLKETP